MRKIICDRCGTEPKEKFFPLVVGADPQQPVDLCISCADAFRRFMQDGSGIGHNTVGPLPENMKSVQTPLQSPQETPQRIDVPIDGIHSEGRTT